MCGGSNEPAGWLNSVAFRSDGVAADAPEKALQEMIRVTRPGGLAVACEANRNAHAAMLHIDEVSHQEAAPLGLFQTINRGIRERTGVDHNIGAKLPVLMHRAGLKQMQIWVSDAARFLYPPLDTDYNHRVFAAICDEGYGQPRPSDEPRAWNPPPTPKDNQNRRG